MSILSYQTNMLFEMNDLSYMQIDYFTPKINNEKFEEMVYDFGLYLCVFTHTRYEIC